MTGKTRNRILKASRAWPLRPHCRRAKKQHRRLCLLLAPLLFGTCDCTPGRRLG